MSAAPPEKQAARGRNVASKPVGGTKSKSTPSAGSSKSSRAPSSSSVASSKSSVTEPTLSKTTKQTPTPDTGFKVTKLSSETVTLNTAWTPRPPAPQPAPRAAAPATTADPLQVAAQVYPWTYMSSTLDDCFKGAEVSATSDLETRATALAEEESEVADQRDRLEAERTIAFFDELASDALAKDAPEIMQMFHSHGDSCARVENEALKLVSGTSSSSEGEEPLKAYHDILHELEELHDQAITLQNSITKLTEESSDPASGETDSSVARSQVNGVFSSCLPVLRARIANLSLAQELIDAALENVTLGLRMESMGLA